MPKKPTKAKGAPKGVPFANWKLVERAGVLVRTTQEAVDYASKSNSIAAGALGLAAVYIHRGDPIPEPLRTYMVERLSEASEHPERISQIFGVVRKDGKGRHAIDNLSRNRAIVELVRQLNEQGYVLKRDVLNSAFEAAHELLIARGTPLSASQIAGIWKGRNK